MTAAEWAALYTNPGAIDHPLDGADLETIIKAAINEAPNHCSTCTCVPWADESEEKKP